MKYLISLLICVIVSSNYFKVLADDPETVLLFSVSTKKMARIGVVNNSDKALRLIIADSENVQLFEQTVKPGEGYFEFHDLSTLPEGSYYIELSKGKQSTRKSFLISGSEIQVLTLLNNQFIYSVNDLTPRNIYTKNNVFKHKPVSKIEVFFTV
jgi:hypothetical protein